MKKKLTRFLVLALALSLVSVSGIKGQMGYGYSTRYVTGSLFVQTVDGSVSVILSNVGSVTHNGKVIVYQNSNPRVSVFNSGNVSLSAGYVSGQGYAIPSSTASEYTVEIFTDSPEVVVSVIIQPACSTLPCTPPREEIQENQLAKFSGEF